MHRSSFQQKMKTKPEGKKKLCTFFVFIPLVRVTYTLQEVSKKSTVLQLKGLIELVCGVPTALQRLHYLDMNDLDDSCILSSLDIVHKATFTLNIWKRWEPLFELIYEKRFKKLVDCVLYDHGSAVPMISTFEKRCETALFLASKLGHVDLLKSLVDLGVNVKARTDSGHSALHVAIANGQYSCIDFLLENGAKNDTKTRETGRRALRIAKQYGHEYSERHLYLFEWKSRAKTAKCKPSRQVELLTHQQFDSKTPTWFNGSYGTKFVCSTLPYSEFSGTRIDAPKVRAVKPPYTNDEEYFYKTDTGSSRLNSYISYDTWIQKKNEQKLLTKQAFELTVDQQDKERSEQEKKKLLSLRRRENEKRTTAIREALSGKSKRKPVIYEEYAYAPSYSKTLLSQYLNDLTLNI